MTFNQQATIKARCSKCGEKFDSKSVLHIYCDPCGKIVIIENERKKKAERIMDYSKCGFCGKIILEHKEFDMKKCLFSLRGYIIPNRITKVMKGDYEK